MFNYFTSALASIRSNKIRSFLTVLGVVIGTSSVVILISLGQGLKNDVSSLIQGLGSNVVAVIAGKIDTQNIGSSQTNPAQFVATDILTLDDVATIKNIEDIAEATPMTLVGGALKYNDKTAAPLIIGAKPEFAKIVETLKIDQGKIFDNRPENYAVVISDQVRETLFGSQNPYLKKVTLGPDEFLVLGTFKKQETAGVFGSDFNNLALIPFDAATKLNKDQVKIFRIIAKAKSDTDVKAVKEKIRRAILANHKGEEDFSVLTQDEILAVFDKFLNLATLMVSAIAAISLIVGGIGIMNIMLVTVTERTREIGLRKAVGASRGAILFQFLVEAVAITILGGLIGLGLAIGVDALVAAKTELNPEISASVVLLAVGISTAIGLTFGLYPAWRASRKDPIEALRYE